MQVLHSPATAIVLYNHPIAVSLRVYVIAISNISGHVLVLTFYDMGIQNHRIAGTTGRKMCKDRTFNIIYRISFVLGIDYGQ